MPTTAKVMSCATKMLKTMSKYVHTQACTRTKTHTWELNTSVSPATCSTIFPVIEQAVLTYRVAKEPVIEQAVLTYRVAEEPVIEQAVLTYRVAEEPVIEQAALTYRVAEEPVIELNKLY